MVMVAYCFIAYGLATARLRFGGSRSAGAPVAVDLEASFAKSSQH